MTKSKPMKANQAFISNHKLEIAQRVNALRTLFSEQDQLTYISLIREMKTSQQCEHKDNSCDCDTKKEKASVQPPTEPTERTTSVKSMKRIQNHLPIEKCHLNRLIELHTAAKLRSKKSRSLDESINPPQYVNYADMLKMLEKRLQVNEWLHKKLTKRINNNNKISGN